MASQQTKQQDSDPRWLEQAQTLKAIGNLYAPDRLVTTDPSWTLTTTDNTLVNYCAAPKGASTFDMDTLMHHVAAENFG